MDTIIIWLLPRNPPCCMCNVPSLDINHGYVLLYIQSLILYDTVLCAQSGHNLNMLLCNYTFGLQRCHTVCQVYISSVIVLVVLYISISQTQMKLYNENVYIHSCMYKCTKTHTHTHNQSMYILHIFKSYCFKKENTYI